MLALLIPRLIRSDRPESDRNPHVETLPYPHRRDGADRAFQFHRFTHTTHGLYPSPLTRVVRCQIGGKRALARLADLRLLPCIFRVSLMGSAPIPPNRHLHSSARNLLRAGIHIGELLQMPPLLGNLRGEIVLESLTSASSGPSERV